MQTFESVVAALPEEPMLTVPQLPFEHLASGKVREIYDLGDRLLIVASDRLSAFDVILPDGIPGKGVLLTQLSLWWFAQAEAVFPTHLVPEHGSELGRVLADFPDLRYRSMLVKKLKPMPLEAVVRGYLAGSGWSEYQKTGALWGHVLPAGLRESEALAKPLFTPTTKAAVGDKDLPVTPDEGREILGRARFDAVQAASLKLYQLGVDRAAQAGLLLADTKFEFGEDASGKLFLIDEVLTPDSSRYWPADQYAPGRGQPSFDKQFVRDYLNGLDWDKTPPGPSLPADIISRTRDKYLEALRLLMG